MFSLHLYTLRCSELPAPPPSLDPPVVVASSSSSVLPLLDPPGYKSGTEKKKPDKRAADFTELGEKVGPRLRVFRIPAPLVQHLVSSPNLGPVPEPNSIK